LLKGQIEMNNQEKDPEGPELNEYTRTVLEQGISRRRFLSRAAAGTAAATLLGVTGNMSAAVGPHAASKPAVDYGKSSDGGAELSFLVKPDAIPDRSISETLTFDVIVVGAGAAGVPAALSAAENGAKVGVIQKAPFALSQGNTGSGIDLAKSDKAAIEALVSRVVADNDHRCDRRLIQSWAYNSGEAVSWVIDRARKGGSPVVSEGNLQHMDSLKVNGYSLSFVTAMFGPKPYSNGDGMRHLAITATNAGVQFFYNTRAIELIHNAAGDVIGVIARNNDSDKYTKFLATKGVILATGDYQNDKEMSDYFVPDAKYFGRKQMGKTGDGHKMAYWAGGVIEPIGHTKMAHDFDGGPAPMCDMPFMTVNRLGHRFMNETAEMSVINNYLRDAQNAGNYAQLFDSNYMTQAADWPGKLMPPPALKNWMPDVAGPKKGVYDTLLSTFMADTLEDLARKLEIDPPTLIASVKRYNELVALGRDEDFGKPANLLHPIEKAPFYGIHRTLRVSAICSGMLVDEHHRALDAEAKPIRGLHIIGNLGGGFYGGVDYPLTVFGLSLGRCYTFGYIVGREVAKL
jgi:fumarate reductase flavoprotein subunit